jgi:linoleoyl-CoA desaturase
MGRIPLPGRLCFGLGARITGPAIIFPDENGYIDNNWTIHQLSVTTNYATGNRFLTWALGGLNYHAVHHLFPNICHVHYRDLDPIIKETTDKHGVPYRVQPTFLSAVSNHAKMLKLLGRGSA